MSRDLRIPVASAGEPISATGWNNMRKGVMQHQGVQFGFSSNLGLLTRPPRVVGTGTAAIYGKIDTAVPAGGIVADAIDAYYRDDSGTLVPLLDDADVQIRYAAQNMNSFSNIVIYNDPADAGNPIKVFVWGFPFSYNFGTVEVPDVQTVMEIWNPPTELALYEGYVKAPANAVGQVPMHHNGFNKTVVEAGPCGGVV